MTDTHLAADAVGRPAKGLDVPRIVLVFLALDLAFLAINVVWRLAEVLDLTTVTRWYLLQIHSDYGLPEITNFAKYLAVAGVLVWGTGRHGLRVWGPMAAGFLFLFLDDSLRLHETASYWVGDRYLIDAAGNRKDAATLGQFPYYVIAALVVFGGAFLTLARTAGREAQLARRMIGLLVILGALATGVDFVNSYILERIAPDWVSSIGSMVENGGELIVISLCVWVAVLVRRHLMAQAPATA